MKSIESLKELQSLFASGKLNEKENDVLIFDKHEVELQTDKDYTFSMDVGDLAFEALHLLGWLRASGV